MKKYRYTESDIIDILEEKGIIYLEGYENRNSKITVRCQEGHEYEGMVRDLVYSKKPKRCRICYFVNQTDDINNRLKKYDFTLARQFIGTGKMQPIECLKCSHIFNTAPHWIFTSNRKCPGCSIKTVKFQKKFIDKLNKLNIVLLSEYKDHKTNVKMRCLGCGKIWKSLPGNMVRENQGCSHCVRSIPLAKAQQRLRDKKKNITIIDNYTCITDKALLQCDVCQYKWKAVPDQVWRLSGCPLCNTHRNEKLTLQFIQNILPHIKLKHQHTIKLVNNTKGMIIDFYFSHFRRQFFIEYNGYQHYHPVDFFGGKKGFENRQRRDKKLRQYCKKNDIVLIEIDGRKYKEDKIKPYLRKQFYKYGLISIYS